MPRIAVFGHELAVDRPIAMSTWDNRLLVQNALEDQDKVEIYYKPANGGVTRIVETDANAHELIEFLARRP